MKWSVHQTNEPVSLKLNVLYHLSFISLNYSISSDTKAALLSPYGVLQPHVRLFTLPSLYPWGEISGWKTEDKPSYVCASPPRRSLLFSQRVYFSFFPPLKAEFLALATRDRFTHPSSSFEGNLWKPIQLSPNQLELRDSTGACVRVCVCSRCTSFPGAVHSYKPCSVFIDAVYFVLYQINNKTQTRPEEQKRKVIHSWVEPIYIRRSALGALCAWPCIFAIMLLHNNNRNILTNKWSEATQDFGCFSFFFFFTWKAPHASLPAILCLGWWRRVFPKTELKIETLSRCIYWD